MTEPPRASPYPMRYPATETSPSAVVTSRALLAPVARMRAGSRWFAMTSMRCTGRAVGMTGPASQGEVGQDAGSARVGGRVHPPADEPGRLHVPYPDPGRHLAGPPSARRVHGQVVVQRTGGVELHPHHERPARYQLAGERDVVGR